MFVCVQKESASKVSRGDQRDAAVLGDRVSHADQRNTNRHDVGRDFDCHDSPTFRKTARSTG